MQGRETETGRLPELTAVSEEIRAHPSRLTRAGLICGKLAALGAVVAGTGVASAFMASTDTTLGPHNAEVELTLDGNATFDMGPIGSIIKPLDEGSIGAHITLQEVPVTSVEEGSGLSTEYLQEYARFFTNIDGDVSEMKADILAQGIRHGLYGGGMALGLYGLIGRRRRQELFDKVSDHGLKGGIAGLAALNLLVASTIGLAETSAAEGQGAPVDSAFAGTPLEGTYITDVHLREILNTHGVTVMEYLEQNDRFYDAAKENLRTAFAEQRALKPQDDYQTILFYTDVHCNVGMMEIIGETARLSEATLIADGGDTTMAGTALENFCINVLDDELPNVERIVAGGNHDSHETEAQLRKNGFTILSGEVIEVNGLRILGDDDRMRSEFGEKITQEGSESVAQMEQRLAEAACASAEPVDLLLTHTPATAQATLQRGCTQLSLDGHHHSETIETITAYNGRQTLHINGDNASGTEQERPSLGPIETSTSLYLIKISEERGAPVFYQVISINPDASVELQTPVYVPQND